VSRVWPRNVNFIAPGEEMVQVQIVRQGSGLVGGPPRAFLTAGPVEKVFWDPRQVRAAIVTCGGLCPGLNTVIREIVMCMHYVYKVPVGNVFGIPGGYKGFYEKEWRVLTPTNVSEIHAQGGTILGSSRGEGEMDKMLDALQAKQISILYVIGGDGTHRGALAILKAAQARNMRLSVAGVPKTIDNDIPVIDKSFGFDTAVEQAVQPISCAHTEARAAKNGIGLVKLMGRHAGFIALYASMASRDVNVTLIPEAPWRMATLLKFLEDRLSYKDHCLIVVAEGAESVEMKEMKEEAARKGEAVVRKDESGNVLHDDIGLYLKDAINNHFKNVVKQPCNLKYIDPSYIIRSSPPNASDSNLCTALAFNAVHGAFAGRTGFTVGTVDNTFVWLPIAQLCSMPSRQVDDKGRLYARMCTTTGQPCLI
jgi:6-phosphofructokinase 1